MKKSSVVKATLVGLLATALTSCEQQAEVQTCVDQNNVVQDDQNCVYSDQQKAAYNNIPPSPVPDWWYYHWIFGGRSHDHYRHGSFVYGGSSYHNSAIPTVRSSVVGDAAVSESGHVSFGGFGSVGEAHAGGGEGVGE